MTVAVSPAFAAKWLPARIENFQALCPETDVRLDTNLKLIDFAVQGIDVGVRYGRSAWLSRAGAAEVESGRGMQVNNSAAVLQAAIDGHDVALARSVMAHDDVAAGRLVRLFPDLGQASELAYYVVYRAECASSPKLQAFREWLLLEVSRF